MKQLMIDPQKNKFNFAVVECGQICCKGRTKSLYNLRKLQKSLDILDQRVHIDAGYLTLNVVTCSKLFSWNAIKFKSDDFHFIDHYIYGDSKK